MKDGVQSGLPENPLVEAVVVAVELKRAVGGGGGKGGETIQSGPG